MKRIFNAETPCSAQMKKMPKRKSKETRCCSRCPTLAADLNVSGKGLAAGREEVLPLGASADSAGKKEL